MQQVGLTTDKQFTGSMPLLHDKLMRDIQIVEDDAQHLYIITGRRTITIEELERTEVPVAGNDKRMLFCVAIELSGRERLSEETEDKEEDIVVSFHDDCFFCYFLTISVHLQGMVTQTMVP